MREKYDYFSLPLMARENSIIAVGNNNQLPDYDYSQNLTLHIFELSEQKPAYAEIVNQDGKTMLNVSAVKTGNQVAFTFDGKTQGLSVILRNVRLLRIFKEQNPRNRIGNSN